MRIKTTRNAQLIHGEDIRAGQFIALDLDSGGQRLYRVLRNERDRRGGGGALYIMDSDKGKWWRGYQGYDRLRVVVRKGSK